MKLKSVYDNSAEIPEAYRELYSEREGRMELTAVEGVRTNADIERLQESLRKERDDHKATREKLSGNVSATATENAADPLHQDGELMTLKQQLNNSETTIAELSQALSQNQIRESVQKAAVEQNVLSVALDDVLLLAESMFVVDVDGRTSTHNANGYEDGLDAKQWLEQMKNSRPHWWPTSISAQASGGSRQLLPDNPWSKDSWNLTAQGQMLRANPDRAKRLASAAGTHLET